MSDWWSYRLDDLLLFSPRVYWRMFELHNAAWWPLHVVTFAIGLAIVLLLPTRAQNRDLWIALVLAALWAFVGWSFLWTRYAAINWAVSYLAPAFWLQALMLAAGAAGEGLAFDRRDVAGWLGCRWPRPASLPIRSYRLALNYENAIQAIPDASAGT